MTFPFIYNVGRQSDADVVITEVGGTTGDIESQPFLEAIRQVGLEVGRENSLYIHVTLVPYLRGSEEHKTKPTQHSVKELQGMGIAPDIIVLRCDEPLEESIFKKIAMFCNVPEDCVIENMTIPTLYEAPMMLEKNHFSDIVCRELGIAARPCDMRDWEAMLERIALIHFSYISITKISLLVSKKNPQDNSVLQEVLFSCSGCTMIRFALLCNLIS